MSALDFLSRLHRSRLEEWRWWAGGLAVFYAVGVAGTLFSVSQELFLALTPSFLLLNMFLLLWFQPARDKKSLLFAAAAVYASGWSVEWLGVHTGFPFGNYVYGDTLGWKLDAVPLLIGANWVLLTLAAVECLRNWQAPNVVKAAAAGVVLTLLDYLIEPVAVRLEYWNWHGVPPPWQNYAGWFGVASFLSFIWLRAGTIARSGPPNPLAAPLLGLQTLYFLALNVGLRA